MRIAYLARRHVPSKRAHSVQIVKMCEAFARLGHEVRLYALPGEPGCTFSRYGVDQVFGIETLPPRGKRLAKPRFLMRLMPRLRAFDADLYFGRDIVSLALASLIGRPVAYEAHVKPGRKSPRGRLLRWLFARPNFALLACTTSTLAQAYRRDYPALAGKTVLVAPNAAMSRIVASDSAQLDWPGRAKHVQVGFVGRPFQGKGIEMMDAAARRLPAIDFHVVGATAEDCPWIGDELPDNLHFHGYQANAGLDRFYRHFDIAAAPYGREVMNASNVESAAITSPLKLIEYMEAGLPTIVSDLPGVRDIVGDGEFVELVVPGDPDDFIAAVDRLATESDRRRDLGLKARRAFEQRHTTRARAEALLDALPPSIGARRAV